ncbi:MAG: glycosyltransferase [Candidatus Peribacteraceae bacterium]|jgi:glycosyltransferase involved in cell wall biosynthesis
MKILHICTKDTGGAGKAALRLHHGLKSISVGSKMLVLHRSTSDSDVTALVRNNTIFNRVQNNIRKRFIVAELKAYDLSRGFYYTTNKSIYRISSHPLVQEADIIHLHWIAGMVDYAEFFSAMKHKPIVWTLHDANPFTGGCHVPGACTRYASGCGACPALQSQNLNDLSRRIVERKKEAYQGQHISIVTPSRWMQNCAKKSLLLREHTIAVIPNGVPTNVFKKRDRIHSRKQFHLPQNAVTILFGADYRATRKGFEHLVQALDMLVMQNGAENIMLVTFGPKQDLHTLPMVPHFPIRQLGYIVDEEVLAALYASCDMTVITSLWESFSLICIESMACGTPVVGYRVGELPDVVIPHKTGLLTEMGNIQGLAEAIEYMVAHPQKRRDMGEKAREFVEQKYNIEIQARRYLQIYETTMKA